MTYLSLPNCDGEFERFFLLGESLHVVRLAEIVFSPRHSTAGPRRASFSLTCRPGAGSLSRSPATRRVPIRKETSQSTRLHFDLSRPSFSRVRCTVTRRYVGPHGVLLDVAVNGNGCSCGLKRCAMARDLGAGCKYGMERYLWTGSPIHLQWIGFQVSATNKMLVCFRYLRRFLSANPYVDLEPSRLSYSPLCQVKTLLPSVSLNSVVGLVSKPPQEQPLTSTRPHRANDDQYQYSNSWTTEDLRAS